MLPSASLDAQQKGLYEPIHGSAPDIAGQDKANPLATILSLAMMFRYTFARADVADRIERAVRKVLQQGLRTGDIALPGEKSDRHARDGRRRRRGVAEQRDGDATAAIKCAAPKSRDAEAMCATFAAPQAMAGTLQLPFPTRRDVAQAHRRFARRRLPAGGGSRGRSGRQSRACTRRRSRRAAGTPARIGMSVRDDWQRRGVGSALMHGGDRHRRQLAQLSRVSS